jgi:hypothetical protein
LELSELSPAAVQADADEQETLVSWANCDPVGFGVGFTVQPVMASQCSASVTNVPELFRYSPTATHAEDDTHETENRMVGWPGLGGDSMVQLPSQRSASASWSDAPTATHSLEEVQSISFSVLNCAPDGFGVGCTVQLAPSQRSASVTGLPELSV